MARLQWAGPSLRDALRRAREEGRVQAREWALWQDLLCDMMKRDPGLGSAPHLLKKFCDGALEAWRMGLRESEQGPTVVCLVGSTRFYEAFRRAEYEEEKAGRIVLSIGFKPDVGPGEHGQNVGVTPEQKEAIDELHLRKIDMSHEILVLNVNNCVAETTSREIIYASEHNKGVRWLNPPTNVQRDLVRGQGGLT